MRAALASIIHDRQRAHRRKHHSDESYYKGGLHFDLAIAGPPSLPAREFPSLKLNAR